MPDMRPATSTPYSLGRTVKEGLRIKLMNHPRMQTAVITTGKTLITVKRKTSQASSEKEIRRTNFAPNRSETKPPNGFDTIPTRLKTERAMPAQIRLKPNSSCRIRGSQPMKT